jgi:anti-sigma regulatory factor (Ser/Thr protein kinase)
MEERTSRTNVAIREFIIRHLDHHPSDIASYTSKRFNISRMTPNRYLDELVKDGLVVGEGETKARKYKLVDFVDEVITFNVSPSTEEDVVWREKVKPLLRDLPNNVLTIFQYSVSEMLNNVIDHSESPECSVRVLQNANRTQITICDSGVGIFDKIAKAAGLADKREAILELAKGKLTTDPERHSGEGIFFTSRALTRFSIISDDLTYVHNKERGDDEWLIEDVKPGQGTQGTCVLLEMHNGDKQTLDEVFNKYNSEGEGPGIFSRTHVPISLARYPNEQLVSRSQAKRVLTRFNRFSEVILDFSDVPTIGQAFADEIFRVFRKANPEIKLIPARANPQVQAMIDRALNARNEENDPASLGTRPA